MAETVKDVDSLLSQRRHLHRQKRSLAWAYMIACRSNEDATEILAELQRLSCDLLALDLLIEEAARWEWIDEAWAVCVEVWGGYRVV